MSIAATQWRVRERKSVRRGVRVAYGQVLRPLMNLKQWTSIGLTGDYFLRDGLAIVLSHGER